MPIPKKSVESSLMKEDARKRGGFLFDALGFKPGIDIGLLEQDSAAELKIGDFSSFHNQIKCCPGNLDQLPKFFFGKILILYHRVNSTSPARQNQLSKGLDMHYKA